LNVALDDLIEIVLDYPGWLDRDPAALAGLLREMAEEQP